MAEVRHLTADVFGVSRGLPTTYVERDAVDDKLLDNLTREKHVVIYGSSKQGKTCLRLHCLQDDDYISIQCQNNWDLAKLSEAILKGAGYEVEISTSRTADGKSKLQVKAKSGFALFGIGKAEAELGSEGERGHSETTASEPLQLDPSDPNDLVRALKGIEFKKFIVLEDFHYLPQETQEQFAFALKTIHETSKITFIIVAVWREENRLIVHNGDLAGRIISVDADAWTSHALLKVIAAGETLLNVQFPERFKYSLIEGSLNSVYIVQECCYKACKQYGVNETQDKQFLFLPELDAQRFVSEVIHEQGARYTSFLTNFAAGFQDTQLNMFKWLLFPVLTADVKQLGQGLSYRTIRTSIQAKHPEGVGLNAGNITQALNSVPALQAKKNIKPFILDYDRSNLRLSVVDKGFLIWLAVQDRTVLLESLDLPTPMENSPELPLDRPAACE
jgi:hypothetical protein